MSLRAPSLTASFRGEVVNVPITQTSSTDTNKIAGLQYDLQYDPDALTYIDYAPGPVAPVINPDTPGNFRFIISDLAGIPEDLGRITFEVNGNSSLLFVNVVASDVNANEWRDSVNNNTILIENGQINLEETIMNIGFTWTDPNPAGRVLNWSFYESTDSGTTFTAVLTGIAAADRRLDYDVPADSGEHQFYLVGVGQFGTSPPSNVLLVDSNIPLPPVLSFE